MSLQPPITCFLRFDLLARMEAPKPSPFNSAERKVEHPDALVGINGNRLARDHIDDIETPLLFATPRHYHGIRPCNASTAKMKSMLAEMFVPTATLSPSCMAPHPIQVHQEQTPSRLTFLPSGSVRTSSGGIRLASKRKKPLTFPTPIALAVSGGNAPSVALRTSLAIKHALMAPTVAIGRLFVKLIETPVIDVTNNRGIKPCNASTVKMKST